MVVMTGAPLKMVVNPAFKSFCQKLYFFNFNSAHVLQASKISPALLQVLLVKDHLQHSLSKLHNHLFMNHRSNVSSFFNKRCCQW
jgi:hypothetical protein